MRALAYFHIILLGCALLLLMGARDRAGLARLEAESRADQIECVADRYAAGATYQMAISLCGGLDPDALERDLP